MSVLTHIKSEKLALPIAINQHSFRFISVADPSIDFDINGHTGGAILEGEQGPPLRSIRGNKANGNGRRPSRSTFLQSHGLHRPLSPRVMMEH